MKFGLIGHPIAHSKSPELFKEAFGNCGDSYDLIETASFEEAYCSFLKDYDAVNVTMPFKELAFSKAQPANRETSILQATNLLKKEDGVVKCYNTDYLGVKNILSNYILFAENVLVIGFGGAGKAAALAAYDAGFCVTIANRTPEKAIKWVEDNHFNDISCCDLDHAPIGNNEIIIYTLPLLAERFSRISLSGKIVIEANYASPALCDKVGMKEYISGEVWLKEQADFGFELMRR